MVNADDPPWFTQDENNRKVYDGAWPIIAGKRVTLNTRFALPDGAGKLYQTGAEGPHSGETIGQTLFAVCRRRAFSIASAR